MDGASCPRLDRSSQRISSRSSARSRARRRLPMEGLRYRSISSSRSLPPACTPSLVPSPCKSGLLCVGNGGVGGRAGLTLAPSSSRSTARSAAGRDGLPQFELASAGQEVQLTLSRCAPRPVRQAEGEWDPAPFWVSEPARSAPPSARCPNSEASRIGMRLGDTIPSMSGNYGLPQEKRTTCRSGRQGSLRAADGRRTHRGRDVHEGHRLPRPQRLYRVGRKLMPDFRTPTNIARAIRSCRRGFALEHGRLLLLLHQQAGQGWWWWGWGWWQPPAAGVGYARGRRVSPRRRVAAGNRRDGGRPASPSSRCERRVTGAA